MNIKTIGLSILFMFSVSAQANQVVVQSITRVQTVVAATNGVTAPAALATLAATVAGRQLSSGTVSKLEEISNAVQAINDADSQVEGFSDALRIETLVNIFTVVALTDSDAVINFVTGKPYMAAVSPNNQSDDDRLDGDSLTNFNSLLTSVLASNPQTIASTDMDSAIQASPTISANSLAEMDPCLSGGNAAAR
jgi:hypothetical protein